MLIPEQVSDYENLYTNTLKNVKSSTQPIPLTSFKFSNNVENLNLIPCE